MTNPVRSQCVETTRVGPAAIAADGRLGAARLGRWGGGADEEGGLCTVALLLALCAGVVLVPTGAQWAQLSVTLLAFERAALLPLVGLVGSRMGVHSKDAFDVVVALGTWVALGLSRAGGAGGAGGGLLGMVLSPSVRTWPPAGLTMLTVNVKSLTHTPL